MSVLLGNGDGTFGAKTDFGTGSNPHSVAIGDLNGDGKPDLAVANSASNTVSVLLGNGDGTFGAKTDFATGVDPRSVAIGDVNGDGKPDLAVANCAAPTRCRCCWATATGPSGRRRTSGRGPIPSSVAIGDLNGGREARPGGGELQRSNTVSVLLGNGDGTFGAKTDFGDGEQAPFAWRSGT